MSALVHCPRVSRRGGVGAGAAFAQEHVHGHRSRAVAKHREYDSFAGTLGTNLLVTYRINALTVFYAGYDDHYRQGDVLDRAGDRYFPTSALRPTNRALSTKRWILFRY